MDRSETPSRTYNLKMQTILGIEHNNWYKNKLTNADFYYSLRGTKGDRFSYKVVNSRKNEGY